MTVVKSELINIPYSDNITGYDKDEYNLIKKEIKSNMVCLDIGAGFGVYARLMAQKGKEVYAFEPNKRRFNYLVKYTEELKNIKNFNLACSNKKGQVKYHMHFDDKEKESQCICLDDFLGDIKVDFVKIDIEGHEQIALEGMEKIIRNSNKIKIFSEVSSKLETGDYISYIDYLKSLGFDIYYFKTGTNLKKLEGKKYKVIFDWYEGLNYTCDILCIKK